MNIDNIYDLETKEQFLERVYRKGKSYEAKEQARSAINNLNYYSKSAYQVTIEEILKELANQPNARKVTTILNGFVDWCTKDHPEVMLDKKRHLNAKKASTIRPYLTQIRKYMKFCFGIRINDDDFRDFVLDYIEPDDDDEEPDPLTKEELRTIIDNAPNPRRKTFYMVAKDTSGRLKELLQLKKENFDFSKKFVKVTFPKSITKGRSSKRTSYLTPETATRIKVLLNSLKDSDNVFSTNLQSIKSAKQNESSSWKHLIESLGKHDPKWSAKYKNGRLKKNFHSIRAFCETQIKQATKDKDYADAYVGHKRYLPQYIRLEEKEHEKLFEKCVPFLSIYEKYEIIDPEEKMKELERVKQKIESIENYVYSTRQPMLEQLATNPQVFWKNFRIKNFQD